MQGRSPDEQGKFESFCSSGTRCGGHHAGHCVLTGAPPARSGHPINTGASSLLLEKAQDRQGTCAAGCPRSLESVWTPGGRHGGSSTALQATGHFKAQIVPVEVRRKDILTSMGGAIAHGRPIGETGAVLTKKLAHSMRYRGLTRGLVTLCNRRRPRYRAADRSPALNDVTAGS
jgi:hypothetical protein